MAFDPSGGGSTVLPLGNKTLWEYSNGLWAADHPNPYPPATTWSCLTYDPSAGALVYFGGGSGGSYLGGIGFADYARNATWLFTGGAWENVTPTAGSIPPLKYPACAYDPSFAGGAVVLMGGANSSYDDQGTWLMTDTNSTWAFVRNSDSGDFEWVQLHPSVSPAARFGAAMAYDSATGQLILYGGAQNGTSTANGSCSPALCPHFHDTWEFSGTLASSTWTDLSGSGPAPPGSVLTDMVYDPIDGYVVDFGGQDNGYKSPNATQNATWAFDGSGWRNLTPSFSPGARFGAAIAFDNATGHVLMIGGLSGTVVDSPVLYDLWEYAHGAWDRLGPSATYAVTFGETGLPRGTTWNVTVVNRTSAVTTSLSSATSQILFDVPSGEYEYTIGPVEGYHTTESGLFSVDATADSLNVTFSVSRYDVRFSETGLTPSWKTSWCVTFNSSQSCTRSGSLEFRGVPNGSYSYTIDPLANYTLKAPYSGIVEVIGGPPGSVSNIVKVPWHLNLYSVAFQEKGLPKGTSWTVTFDDRTTQSSSSKITFSVSNGSYRFNVSATGYRVSPSNGTLDVTGSALVQEETFMESGAHFPPATAGAHGSPIRESDRSLGTRPRPEFENLFLSPRVLLSLSM